MALLDYNYINWARTPVSAITAVVGGIFRLCTRDNRGRTEEANSSKAIADLGIDISKWPRLSIPIWNFKIL